MFSIAEAVFVPSGYAFQEINGIIKGEKLSGVHWLIDANLSIEGPGDPEINLKASFFENYFSLLMELDFLYPA